MKTKWLICFIFVASTFSCKRELQQTETSLDDNIALASESIFSDLNYSRQLLQEVMNETSDSMQYYSALQVYGQTYFIADRPDSALYLARRVVNFANSRESLEERYTLLTLSYNDIGNCHGLLRRQDSALYYYTKALESYEATGKREKSPDLCINIADMHMRSSNFAQSAFYYRRALFISDSLNMTEQLGFPIYTGLAQLYMELRDFELSSHYFDLAESSFEGRALNEQFFYCTTRANYHFFNEEYNDALSWLRKGKALLLPGSYLFSANLINANMGESFFRLNEIDSARHYLDEAATYFSSIEGQPLMYHINTIKAGMALQEGNSPMALHYLRKNSYNTNDLEPILLRQRDKYLQEYYFSVGNFKEAYTYLLKNVAMDDSIRSERTHMRIADIDMRYSQDTTLLKQEALIAGQASDIETLRMRSMIWIMASLLIAAISLIAYILMKKKRELQWLTFHDQITRLRLLNIRNRISPHFLFNILNREISEEDGPDRSYLSRLVLLLRKSLEMADQTTITLHQELEFVQDYIELERESLGKHFSLEWSIEPTVDPTAVMLPPMLIQIPVENALKHGLRPIEGEKKLSMSVTGGEGGTSVIITDNGSGYKMEQKSSIAGTGTGLKVLYQTIDLFNSKNREKIVFTIEQLGEEERGTKVYIFLPDDFKFG